MFKYLFTIMLSFSSYCTVLAQETKEPVPDSLKLWKTGGVFIFSTSQLSLTNWAAGGQSSISGTVLLSLFANLKKEKTVWDNSLDIGYGLIKQDGTSFTKSDDRIELSSKYGHEAFKNWYYSALISFNTQFAPGYKLPDDSNKISNFLAPGYILLSFGLDYKPNKKFALLLAPLTGKVTIVGDQTLADAGAFGVAAAVLDLSGLVLQKGKNVRTEFGGAIKVVFKDDIAKNVNLATKLNLFSNYLDRPENIDIAWDMLITMKINKFLSASISTNLIYDHDIKIAQDTNNDGLIDKTGPATQFKEVFGLGLTFKF